MPRVSPGRPSLVVSSINPNANVGKEITCSGTVAAVMEAAIDKSPAIAVSLERRNRSDNCVPAAVVAARLARCILRDGMPRESLLTDRAIAAGITGFNPVGVSSAGNMTVRRSEAPAPGCIRECMQYSETSVFHGGFQ